MEAIIRINPLSITYNDITQLIIRPISGPFTTEDGLMFKAYISFHRVGYEVNVIEERNINLPFEYMPLLTKFSEGTATEADALTLNAIMQTQHPSLAIDMNLMFPPPVEEPEEPSEDVEA